MRKSLSVCFAVLLLGGCGNMNYKHDYQKALNLGITTSATVAVGTLDHRPYVVNGQKAQRFVGLSHGGLGSPFNITTQSGKPLASDISGSIVASMIHEGVAAKAVELKPALSFDEARTTLRAAGTQRLVVIRLLGWNASCLGGGTYDFVLSVFDKDGKLLVSKPQQAHWNLGRGDPNIPCDPRFSRRMELLFQEPDVAKALQP